MATINKYKTFISIGNHRKLWGVSDHLLSAKIFSSSTQQPKNTKTRPKNNRIQVYYKQVKKRIAFLF